jgi:hypothetical protein
VTLLEQGGDAHRRSGPESALPGASRERRHRALPGRRQPLLVVEHAGPSVAYAGEHLLAPPPGPPWRTRAHRLASHALRHPICWRLLPAVAPPDLAPVPWAAVGRRPEHVHVIALHHSRDADSSTVLLLIPAESGGEGLVVKVADAAPARARLLAEAEQLRRLHATTLGVATRAALPELVALAEDTRSTALVTTAVPGTSLLVRFHRLCGRPGLADLVERDLWAAATWLEGFRRDTRGGRVPLSDPADPTLPARLAAGPGSDAPILREALDALDRARARLAGLGAPGCAVHGDFWMGNLLGDGVRVRGVVDWEHFRPAGEPTADLVRLILTEVTYLDRHTRPGRAVRGLPGLRAESLVANVTYALHGTGRFPDLIRGFAGHQLNRLGLPHDCLPDLLAVEAARIAAEASDAGFARAHLELVHRLTGAGR